MNIKVKEPLKYEDETEKMNKKIDKINKKKIKRFKEKVKDKKNKIESIRGIMRNLPVAPEQPKLYTFDHKDASIYPIDFDMNTYMLLQGNQEKEDNQQAQYINNTLVAPLQNHQRKLKDLREEIKKSKVEKNDLKLEILDLDSQIAEKKAKLDREGEEENNEDDEEEDEDDIQDAIDMIEETKELKENAIKDFETKIQDLKSEIEVTKNIIKGLKFKIVEMLKNLAQKEYMNNPESIFTFPTNNKIKNYTRELKREMGQLEQIIKSKIERGPNLQATPQIDPALVYKGRLPMKNREDLSFETDSSSSSSS